MGTGPTGSSRDMKSKFSAASYGAGRSVRRVALTVTASSQAHGVLEGVGISPCITGSSIHE
eukprot:4855272-Prymnesium_polylepis.2